MAEEDLKGPTEVIEQKEREEGEGMCLYCTGEMKSEKVYTGDGVELSWNSKNCNSKYTSY